MRLAAAAALVVVVVAAVVVGNLALLGYARGKDRVGRLRPTLTVVVPPPATTTTTVPRPSHESDHHGDRHGESDDD